MDSEKGPVPTRDGPDPFVDPGRGWRRLARAGAFVTVLAMVAPGAGQERDSLVESMVTGWRAFPHARWIILRMTGTLDLASFTAILSSLVGLVCTLPFASAVVMSVLCGSGPGLAGPEHAFRMALMSAGVLVAAGTGYVVFLLYLADILGLLWIPHLVLFLAALSLMDGWHRRGSASYLFWPGTFLAVSACAAWGFLLFFYYSLLAGLQVTFPTSRWMLLWNPGTAALLGSVMTAVGWLLWWRALRRYAGEIHNPKS